MLLSILERERKASTVQSELIENRIIVTISNELDPGVYDVPISLKTYVPETWNSILFDKISSKESDSPYQIQKDSLGSFIIYSVMPDESEIIFKPNEN